MRKQLLIVDGYNIIGAWSEARKKCWSIDEARDNLIHRLSDYAGYSGQEIIVVFDGHQSGRMMRGEDNVAGVRVVFTQKGETADHYIERLTDGIDRTREMRVATSDAVEQTVVMGRGAIRISARELLRELTEHADMRRVEWQTQPIKKHMLISRLPKDVRDALEKMRRGEK